MKSLAKFLVCITSVLLLFIVYYVLSSRLSTVVTVETVPANMHSDRFEEIVSDVWRGKYEGVTELGDIGRYSFVTVTVQARSYSLFSAEWAQFKPKKIDGDALIIDGDTGPKDIPAYQRSEFSVTLLTASEETMREGWLDYYIFGRNHSLKVASKAATTN